jgi:hypothetical protein
VRTRILYGGLRGRGSSSLETALGGRLNESKALAAGW